MNLSLRSLRARKEPQLTAMLTQALACHRMLLDEKEDPKGFQDFLNALVWTMANKKFIAYHLDERCGRLRFIVQDGELHKEYEMRMIDNETRMYGSSQSSYGSRLRAMYGTMHNDWYCIRINEDVTDLVVLTAHMNKGGA